MVKKKAKPKPKQRPTKRPPVVKKKAKRKLQRVHVGAGMVVGTNMRIVVPHDVRRRLKVAAALAERPMAKVVVDVLDEHLPKVK